jgi:hypothetical protein
LRVNIYVCIATDSFDKFKLKASFEIDSKDVKCDSSHLHYKNGTHYESMIDVTSITPNHSLCGVTPMNISLDFPLNNVSNLDERVIEIGYEAANPTYYETLDEFVTDYFDDETLLNKALDELLVDCNYDDTNNDADYEAFLQHQVVLEICLSQYEVILPYVSVFLYYIEFLIIRM